MGLELSFFTVRHKHFRMTHPLVYVLGYQEAVVSITQGSHKAMILLLLRYQSIFITANKYEFLVHPIFSCLALVIRITFTSFFFYHVRQYWRGYWQTNDSSCTTDDVKLTVPMKTVQYCKYIFCSLWFSW